MRKVILHACLIVPIFLVGMYLLLPAIESAAARRQFAFQSLEARIPKGKPIPLNKPFTPAAAERWDAHERNLERDFQQRARLLKALHERTRNFFVMARGAGAERQLISDESIMMGAFATKGPAGAQPGAAPDFPVSADEPLTQVDPTEDHYLYYDGAARQFLNPAGFGFIKDRTQVAGFLRHGFGSGVGHYVFKPMKLDYIQLVGILMLDEPAVYLTQGLPSMDQVVQGKTRSLDLFEEAGLKALREGEDLFVASKGETVRMFGALRATKQCLRCHDATRGDLLGALSYTLRPQTPEP